MASVISNEEELRKTVLNALDPVLNYVMEYIKIEEGEDAIKTTVYQADYPSYYQRTYEFLYGWGISVHQYQKDDADIVGMYYYSPSKIPTVERGIHASVSLGKEGELNDIREKLASIIFEGTAGKIFGRGFWTKKRNAMKKLFDRVGKQRLARYIEDGLRRYNIKYERHGYPSLRNKTY